jgi:CO/xanthine dehydrogenase Mo-binding subunit
MTEDPSIDVADFGQDAADRVAGRLAYAIDIELPGMAHAALVRSPVPAGDIVAVDVRGVARTKGVLAVLGPADVAAAGLSGARFGTGERDQPLLAVSRVTHVGEPVAIVVAETADLARRAARQVHLDIRETAAVLDPDAALATGAPVVREGHPDNVLTRWSRSHGDLDAARARTTRTFRRRFSSPAAQQASLEPHVCIARWEDSALDVWTTSQNPSRVAQELQRLFDLPEPVRVRVPPLGGAYGGKNQAKFEPLLAFAARAVGRPVKFVNSRAEEFVTVTRHAAWVDLTSGIDADGAFTYRTASIRWSGGAYALSSVPVARAGGLAVLGPYRIPASAVESVMLYTNLPPAGSFRGLGVSQVAWAGEQQVDEIAATIGLDGIDFRARQLIESGDRLWTGERVADAHWRACLDGAVRQIGLAASPHPVISNDPPIRRGRGVAVAMKHTITPSRSDADVALRSDGRIDVRTSAVDMGQGVPLVLARIVGEALGLPIDRILVRRPDTLRTPFDSTSSSSRLTFAVGSAVELAAQDLVDRLLEGASVRLGVPPDRLRWDAGRIVDGMTGRALDAALLVEGGSEIRGSGSFVNEPQRDPDTGEPVSSSHWHQGAVAVEVAVDIGTGAVRVERIAGAAWAGRVVDAAGARLQNEGNLIFGLGTALFEDLGFADGVPSTTDLLDYRLPSIRDVPSELQTIALESLPGEHAERHGLGESLIPAVAPAIANAIAAATGARIADLPMSPERVLQALDDLCEPVE